MATPKAPMLMKEARCDKEGVLVNWIAPAGNKPDTHTVSWKADSWWSSQSATVPGDLTEFLITDLPPNSKVQVWIYSTNAAGSSAWSDAVEVVTSRDCGVKGPVQPDIVKEVDVSAEELYKVMYTKAFDKFAIEAGMVSNIEIIKYEEKEDSVHKTARVTPPIPESIRTMLLNYMGDQVLTYDEVSVKRLDRREITFKIENVPLVGSYVETAQGKLTLVEVGPNRCRLEGYFDLRINYPVIGYYVAQVIRSQVVKDLTEWPNVGLRFLEQQRKEQAAK